MSAAVCMSSAAALTITTESALNFSWLNISSNNLPASAVQHKSNSEMNRADEPPGQSDIWTMIQSQKPAPAVTPASYFPPLVRHHSSSLMSQKSLEMCTESLGSESGAEDFSSDLDIDSSLIQEEKVEIEQDRSAAGNARAVSYHCSISSRRSPPRSFPPPLKSISRRGGPCLSMRPHRRDGRLVVEAVAVPSLSYLHAHRQDGRLLLSFIDPNFTPENNQESDDHQETEQEKEQENVSYQEDEEEEEEMEEDEEEEVEVLDRGTVVEVKVSTQPQLQSGSMRVHRSSIVINKFVGGAPLTNQNRWSEEEAAPPRRAVATTTTAAAAAVAASSMSAATEAVGPPQENKLLFTSKRRNREELLHHMRRCSELRRPLFFWEPCCIATSS